MIYRAAGRTLGTLVLLGVTAAVVGGAIRFSALAEAPVAVEGSRLDAAAPASDDLARGELVAVPEEPEGGTGTWAVVIGIDDYPGSGRDLRAGVADALDMQALLDLSGVPPTQRQVLLDGAATRAAAAASLDWLASNAGPDATVVVFFSGHVREVHGDPDADGEEADEVMVFADDGLMSDGELTAALNRIPARKAWVAMAGCYAGGFDDVMAPGRLLTGASPEGSLAYENDRFDRTYLVEYMVRRAMLQGAAGGSVQDAFHWAVQELNRDYPRRLPVIFDQVGEPLTLTPPL